jgi:hypothetical protein
MFVSMDDFQQLPTHRFILIASPLLEGNKHTPSAFGRHPSVKGEFLLIHFPLLTYPFINKSLR